ncbi:putative F-box protein [Nymphaea thermarum]|nr:putative F-box protein [Nymphaea thermarum]
MQQVRYEEDIWTEIAKYLDRKSLVRLGMVDHWFHKFMFHESVWKYACLRDLNVSPPKEVAFKWRELYAASFDGSHSYTNRQPEKHIDWMRIGAFLFDSGVALATEKLRIPDISSNKLPADKMVQKMGCCILTGIKPGIWIAGIILSSFHLTDDGSLVGEVVTLQRGKPTRVRHSTMQTLDARHFELFLHKEYKNGTWEYEDVGSHRVEENCCGAIGGIFDAMHLRSSSTAEVLNMRSWIAEPTDFQPRARIACHAVAVNTNLQENEGLQVKYQIMKAGENGPIVSIRVSQQLL